jgi:ABC-2 type transport system ATP-binding protein
MELHGVLYHVPRKMRGQRIDHLLKLFELWDRRDDYVKQFSGGMKRRWKVLEICCTPLKFFFWMSLRWD